jgi:hypothetical protein
LTGGFLGFEELFERLLEVMVGHAVLAHVDPLEVPSNSSMPSKPATITTIRRREILGGLINEYHAA